MSLSHLLHLTALLEHPAAATQHEHCYLGLLTVTGGMALRNEQCILPASQQSQPNAPTSIPVTLQQPAAATDVATADTAAASLQHPLSSSAQVTTVQETAPAAACASTHARKIGTGKLKLLIQEAVSMWQDLHGQCSLQNCYACVCACGRRFLKQLICRVAIHSYKKT